MMDNLEGLRAENARLRAMLKQQREATDRLNSSVKHYEAKEQSISSAILFAVERSEQWDNSMKKLYELGIQRTRLLYARMERVLNELYIKYPALKREAKLKDMTEKFKNVAYSGGSSYDMERNNKYGEDPIKKLLSNLVNYIDDEKEIKTLKRGNAGAAIGMDYATARPSKSGFDINEALNPTEDLGTILESFNLNRSAK
jgi:hypothetical protein